MNELLFLLRVAAAMAVVAVLALVVWRRRKRVVASVCAHLGLEADPFAREARPAEAHRCYANLARERIDLGHQQRFCLASTHNKCPFLATSVQRETGVLSAMRARWRTVSPAIGLVAGRLGRDFAAGLAVANMARDAGRPRTLERLDWRTSAADAGAATVRLGGLVMRLSTMAVRQLVQLRAWTIAHARQPQVVEAVVVVEESTRGAVVAEAEPEALLVLALEPPRMETVVPADPAGPGLSNRVAAAERDLIERASRLSRRASGPRRISCSSVRPKSTSTPCARGSGAPRRRRPWLRS